MDDILYPLHSFKEQFTLLPTIINKESLTKKKKVVICGMGGSAISVSLISLLFPELDVTLHNDYGIPKILPEEKNDTLIILNSYSGSTEEVLDTCNLLLSQGVALAALSRGGELTSIAESNSLPHIILPSVGIEPRFAIGHQIIGLLSLMLEDEKVSILKQEVAKCDIVTAENGGKQLANSLSGKYPILYASKNLFPVAYLIKAAINEGSKVACFANTIPEANHNESQSFVSNDMKKEAGDFFFVFLVSTHDHIRVQKRFGVMSELYADDGYTSARLNCDHTDHTRVFELILTGYFTATYLAIARNEDPYKTPFVQKFKKALD